MTEDNAKQKWCSSCNLVSILLRSREYVQQANIEAEIKHDNEGEYYLDGGQYEIMQETKQLMEQIDQEIKRLEGKGEHGDCGLGGKP